MYSHRNWSHVTHRRLTCSAKTRPHLKKSGNLGQCTKPRHLIGSVKLHILLGFVWSGSNTGLTVISPSSRYVRLLFCVFSVLWHGFDCPLFWEELQELCQWYLCGICVVFEFKYKYMSLLLVFTSSSWLWAFGFWFKVNCGQASCLLFWTSVFELSIPP